MDKEKIQRINFLAHKAKSEGLSDAEKAEQKELRDQYRAEFRKSLNGQLENTVVIDEYGNKTPLSDYNQNKKKISSQKEKNI